MIRAVYDRMNKGKASVLASFLIGVVLLEIVMTCLIPLWREHFYNIMQTKNADLFMQTLAYFAILMTGLGFAQGLKVWSGQLLSFSVRDAASRILLKKWVKGPRKAANYTQAMTEALRNATELYLEIVVEIIISASIVTILIISNFHNTKIIIAAIAYTIVASLLAMLFNRPLIQTDTDLQKTEGSYREAISDIANGNGDFSSKSKFVALVHSYYRYVRVVMYFTLFSRVKGSVSTLVPYILLASSYFSGAITLGDFMSGTATFELIVINSTILLQMYPKLTKARASWGIVSKFYDEVSK